MQSSFRIPLAIAAVLVWTLITVWGVWTPRDPTSLASTITGAIAWNIVGAGAFLLAVVLALRWRDMGFNAPTPWRSLTLFLFPLLYLAIFLTGALFVGLPAPGVLAIVAINTLAVGFSEELAFRGVLFRALVTRLPIWPAIWLTSILFGSVHVINAATTGDLLGAVLQAITAFMSGLFFLAMVLRTGSIWPSMLFHACWDFLLLTTAAGVGAAGAATDITHSAFTVLAPLLLILPNFVYALFLLRKIGQDMPNPPPTQS